MKAVLAALLFGAVAHAGVIVYATNLSGPGESPPNASPGTGFAEVTIDNVANTMRVQVTFAGLLGTTTASHIHCCTAVPFAGTAAVATTTPTFTSFPLGVTSGTYDHTYDLLDAGSYNPTFVTASGGTTAGAESALLAAMAAGETYLNIHSTVVLGGEIRGFLVADTPEPGTFLMAGGILAGIVLRHRQRRK
jgi:hypothetical protein